VCVTKSLYTALSFKVIKIHRLACGRVLDRQKHTERKYCENMAKTSFLKLVFVGIWSVTTTFYFLYLFSSLKRAYLLFLGNVWSLKHSVNLKNHINKSMNVCFPKRAMCNSILFISKLSSATVEFPVQNGFGVSWKGCHRNFERFWSLD